MASGEETTDKKDQMYDQADKAETRFSQESLQDSEVTRDSNERSQDTDWRNRSETGRHRLESWRERRPENRQRVMEWRSSGQESDDTADGHVRAESWRERGSYGIGREREWRNKRQVGNESETGCETGREKIESWRERRLESREKDMRRRSSRNDWENDKHHNDRVRPEGWRERKLDGTEWGNSRQRHTENEIGSGKFESWRERSHGNEGEKDWENSRGESGDGEANRPVRMSRGRGWRDRATDSERGRDWRERATDSEKGRGWRDQVADSEKGRGWRERATDTERGRNWRDRRPDDRARGSDWRSREAADNERGCEGRSRPRDDSERAGGRRSKETDSDGNGTDEDPKSRPTDDSRDDHGWRSRIKHNCENGRAWRRREVDGDERDSGWRTGAAGGGEGDSKRTNREAEGRGSFVVPNRWSLNILDLNIADDPHNLALQIDKQRDEFDFLMNSDTISLEQTRQILQIVNRAVVEATPDPEYRENITNILQAVCTSRFLDTHIVAFVNKMASTLQAKKLSDDNEKETRRTIQQLPGTSQPICKKGDGLIEDAETSEQFQSATQSSEATDDSMTEDFQMMQQSTSQSTKLREGSVAKDTEKKRQLTSTSSSEVAEENLLEDIQQIQQLLTSISHKLPSFACKCSLVLDHILKTKTVMQALTDWSVSSCLSLPAPLSSHTSPPTSHHSSAENLRSRPSLSVSTPSSSLSSTTSSSSPASEQTLHHSVEEDLRLLRDECFQSAAIVHNKPAAPVRRPRRGPDDDKADPPFDFTLMPIIPDQQDLDWTQRPFIRANKTTGAYRDQAHYLDVQFRLLREDFVRPLREGIREFTITAQKNTKRCKDLRLYYQVRVVDVVCGDRLEHVLKFDTSRLQHVVWHHSKRLPFGTLLCLSNDQFHTAYFAVVTERKPEMLAKGLIQVRFENGLDAILQTSSSQLFTMAEPPALFEAYRHVLEALKTMTKTPLPISKHIVFCEREVKPPQYLFDQDKAVSLDMRSLLQENSSFDASSVPSLKTEEWPPLEDTGLDASQLEAIQTALTKELSIIQGPPGTGKTFIGLKVTQVLLDNKNVWTEPRNPRPILVVCYTNHALDQFLEGVLKICPTGIVRVGSQGKSASLEAFNLRNVKRRVCGAMGPSMRECRQKMDFCRQSVDKCTADEKRIEKYRVFGPNDLKKDMPKEHYHSLVQICNGLLRHKDDTQSLTEDWMAFGAMLTKQDGDTDPYTLLVQEVTSLILRGSDTCQEEQIKPADVHALPYGIRAKLYRCWISKLQNYSGHSEILPDKVLKTVVNPKLYAAITAPLLKQHKQEKNFLVRAWLGIQGSSQNVISAVIHGKSTCKEEDVNPDSVGCLPRKVRVQLYRFWLRKYKNELLPHLKRQKKKRRRPHWVVKGLKRAASGVLSDQDLKFVAHKELLAFIQRCMMERHTDQARYMIKAWLGVAEFARDPQALEEVLYRLTGDIPDTPVTTAVEQRTDDDCGEEDENSAQPFQQVTRKKGKTTTAKQTPFSTDDSWTIPEWLRNTRTQVLYRALRSEKPLTEEEASSVTDLWNPKLTLTERVRLYLYWVQRKGAALKESLLTARKLYEKTAKKLQTLKEEEEIKVLERAAVIGMTTTRAARYREVLKKVACPVVILEEAAEVLEAHVVTCLHESCQHLILIGDHQQLRPSPAVYDLCINYHLDLSLFERLVNNKLHHSTLAVQHRMRPEVSRLVRHVYPHLKDHESTLGRPHIRGMKEDVFLLHHEESEVSHQETSSKFNDHEVGMVVRLVKYLLQQGYPSRSITVLAAYIGQVLRLKSSMQDSKFKDVHITAVDNFQGEENDIIILSLVRSNDEGIVGFLGTDNRVCVALSRARNGLYALGNFKILSRKSRLWRNVVTTARTHGQLGDAIVLRCENHPDTEIHASRPKDFDAAPEGGCRLPCSAKLDCGHTCRLHCHGYDRDHREYNCQEKCERQVCKQNLHPCPKLCHEDCGKCMVRVEKTLPECGHKHTVPCSTDPVTFVCSHPCEEVLPCDHQCNGKCGNCLKNGHHVTKCPVPVERSWPCGHVVRFPCHFTPDTAPCYIACETKLACGHVCSGSCGQCQAGRLHVACKQTCGHVLKGCGHLCPLPCGTVCLPCKKVCGMTCKHSSCDHECGVPCPPCDDSCPRKCEHKQCEATCEEQCSPCEKHCEKKLKCGHSCRGFCGEVCVCYTCEKKQFVDLSGRLDSKVPFTQLSGGLSPSTHLAEGCGGIKLVSTPDAHDPEGRETSNPSDTVKDNSARSSDTEATKARREENSSIGLATAMKNHSADKGAAEAFEEKRDKTANTEHSNQTDTEEKHATCTNATEERQDGFASIEYQEATGEATAERREKSASTQDSDQRGNKETHVTFTSAAGASEGRRNKTARVQDTERDRRNSDEPSKEINHPNSSHNAELSDPLESDPNTPHVNGEKTAKQPDPFETDPNIRLIKLPSCKHIFEASALDAHLERTLKSLPLQAPIACPECSRPISENRCWRYQRLIHQRHVAMQKEKQKLIESTAVYPTRILKLLKSLLLLEKNSSFQKLSERAANFKKYCSDDDDDDKDDDNEEENRDETGKGSSLEAGRSKVRDENREEPNANIIFAMSGQCKLTHVLCGALDLLKLCSEDSKETKKQVTSLLKIVEEPMRFLTVQRCRDLTEEARRLSYLTLLHYASCVFKHEGHGVTEAGSSKACDDTVESTEMSQTAEENADCIHQIDNYIQMFQDKAQNRQLPYKDADRVLVKCKERYPEIWSARAESAIRLVILDAPFDEDLCDILKPFTAKINQQKLSADLSANPRLRLALERRRQQLAASQAKPPKTPREKSAAAFAKYSRLRLKVETLRRGEPLKGSSKTSAELPCQATQHRSSTTSAPRHRTASQENQPQTTQQRSSSTPRHRSASQDKQATQQRFSTIVFNPRTVNKFHRGPDTSQETQPHTLKQRSSTLSAEYRTTDAGKFFQDHTTSQKELPRSRASSLRRHPSQHSAAEASGDTKDSKLPRRVSSVRDFKSSVRIGTNAASLKSKEKAEGKVPEASANTATQKPEDAGSEKKKMRSLEEPSKSESASFK